MRKLIWCCSAAGVLAAGSFLSLTYYACRCPNSLVGRSVQAIADASLVMQPLSGLTSLALRTSQANPPAQEAVGSDEECIPDDPQPIGPEPAVPEPFIAQEGQVNEREWDLIAQQGPVNEREWDAAPIVIHEEDPMPQEIPPLPSPPIGMAGMQGPAMLANGCALVMPYCQDDGEEPTTPPIMPGAEDDSGEPIVVGEKKADDWQAGIIIGKPIKAGEKKADDLSEDSEGAVFKEWMNLFEAGKEEEDKPPSAEQLPAPTEEEEDLDEPKCQEDCHRHEQYPGCPRMTCPCSDRNFIEQYYKRPWDLDPNFDQFNPPPAATYLPYNFKQKGSEESNEEPRPHGKKRHFGKGGEDKDECPRTQGVDTMEFRPSDAGLDEYGPEPVH